MSKFGKLVLMIVYGGLCALEAAIIIKNSIRRLKTKKKEKSCKAT